MDSRISYQKTLKIGVSNEKKLRFGRDCQDKFFKDDYKAKVKIEIEIS